MSKFVLGGHWTSVPDGWVALNEPDQDITKRLQWDDNTVDLFHVCHVHEHVRFIDGIAFVKECLRVLKPGGALRIVGPYIEKLCNFNDAQDPLTRNFVKTQVSHYYKNEQAALAELGIDFMDHGKPFLFDSLLKGHNHRFIWSARLLLLVMERVGFSNISAHEPGKSFFVSPEDCLERKIRGLDVQELESQGITIPEVFDPESMVVEAIK